jgi:hypothetical protein
MPNIHEQATKLLELLLELRDLESENTDAARTAEQARRHLVDIVARAMVDELHPQKIQKLVVGVEAIVMFCNWRRSGEASLPTISDTQTAELQIPAIIR